MELTFLGTGSAYPSPTRGASCVALRKDDGVWLFDCGEGSQIQIMRSPIKPGKISKIFITHLHGDHLFGLPGLMCTVSQNNQRTDPVEIYGPKGLRKFIRTNLELSRSLLGFDYIVHEMRLVEPQLPEGWKDWAVDHTSSDEQYHPNEKMGTLIEADENGIWNLYEDSKVDVKAVWLKHRVPSFGFVMQEKPLPGKLDISILKERGVPQGPLYGKIKGGETITLPGGEKISPEEVMGPSRAGRKVVILGDTCDSRELLKIGLDADILVHEATLENGMEEKAIENGHSTPGMAADLARDLNVGKLILTHFSQRYKPLSGEVKEGEESVRSILQQAAAILGEDRVQAAEDFTTISIPLKS